MAFEQKIRQALMWMRLAVAANGLAFGAMCAAAALLLAVIAAKITAPGLPLEYLAPLFLAAALGMGAIHYLRRQLRPVNAALALDQEFGLEERFTSAWHALRSNDTFRSAIIADAERHATAVQARRVARWRFGRPLMAAVLLGIVTAAVHRYAPAYDAFGLRSRSAVAAAEKQAIAAESKTLQELQKRLTETPRPFSGPEPSRVALDLEALQKQFADGHAPTARDAMAKLSSLADRIDQQKQALKEKSETGVSGKEEPGQSESRSLTSDLERALRRGDMERARAELDRLEERANAPGRSEADNKKLGAELGSLAGAVEGQPELSEGLAEAGAGLEGQKPEGVKTGFEKARKALSSIAGAQKEMRQLERTLEELEASKGRLASAANKTEQSATGEAGENNSENASSSQSGGEGEQSGAEGEGQSGKDSSGKPGNQQQGGESSSSKSDGKGGNQGQSSSAGEEGASGSQSSSGSRSEGGQSGQQGGSQGTPGAGQESQGGQSGQESSAGGESGAAQQSGQGQSSERFGIGSGNRGSSSPSGGESGKSESGESQSGGESGQEGEAGNEGESGGESGGEQSGGASQSGGQSGEAGAGQQSSGGSSQSGGGQAGQSSSASSASSGGTAGSTQGSGTGQGEGQGQGGSNRDWGVGSTNLQEGNSYEAKAKSGENRQSARDSRWTEDFIKLYDARITKTDGSIEQAKGKIGEGEFQYSVDVEGKARREAPKTGATQAFLDYREAQKDTLSQEEIPLGYKEFVKDYFDSIEPPKE